MFRLFVVWRRWCSYGYTTFAKPSKQFPSKAWLILLHLPQVVHPGRRVVEQVCLLCRRKVPRQPLEGVPAHCVRAGMLIHRGNALLTTLTLPLITPEMHIPPWLWFSKVNVASVQRTFAKGAVQVTKAQHQVTHGYLDPNLTVAHRPAMFLIQPIKWLKSLGSGACSSDQIISGDAAIGW